MIKINKTKITPQKIAHFAYFTVIILTIFTAYFLFFFLYENIYQTITQSEIIIVLKKEVASETVDINKFNQIIQNINSKGTGNEINMNRNPFE
ncbi:MAG: hypothetical protein AAB906_04280 [Patescibacteria group bacterium]